MTSSRTNVDLSIRVKGKDIAELGHEGRTYVEGREGTEYAVHLRNRNGYRVLVVLSIDGVNAITGQPVTDSPTERGYVLSAGESQTIHGFRLDDTAVANFRFAAADKGYASKEKGLAGTTGVIGVRVYKEKVAPPAPIVKEIHHHHDHWHDRWIYRPWWDHSYPVNQPIWYGMGGSFTTCAGSATYGTTSSCDLVLHGSPLNAVYACSAGSAVGGGAIQAMNCSTQQAAQVENNPFQLGTTFGARTESRVTTVGFEVDYLLDVLELLYTTREGLIALGVDLTKKPKVTFPQAFATGYCTPPTDWRG